MATIYKIRDRRTGRFSPGGRMLLDPLPSRRWTRRGKVWIDLGHLKNHLNQYRGRIPDTWEVVAFEVVERPLPPVPARSYVESIVKKEEEPR